MLMRRMMMTMMMTRTMMSMTTRSRRHSVLNQGFLYTNFDFFYKTSQTVLLVLTFIDMMFEQEAVPVS